MARPREFDVDCALESAMQTFWARGEIDANFDVTALSRHFTAGIQGLRLVGKANPDREVLEDIAKMMLRALDL